MDADSSGQECWRWDNSADFLYDVSEQYLNLTLTSSNVLGSRRCNYVINQYERMSFVSEEYEIIVRENICGYSSVETEVLLKTGRRKTVIQILRA
ncbi:hypothetical protein Avbf_06421 [Armadillidium vulgare]|nr:hypothetical protein Avbf_06421 [Armadillidium vulgare]